MMDIFEEKAIKPMLISEMQKPFNSSDWIYELKLDGCRCVAYLSEKGTDLRNKRNLKLLYRFPELQDIHKQVKSKCILDGELVVMKDGVPDFYELQRRTLMSDSFKIQLAYGKYPASFVAYDILYLKDKQVTDVPLKERKKLLESSVLENNKIAISRYIQEKGMELFEVSEDKELEGVVAKRMDSKYYFDKRTKDWIKFKRMADEEFVICGYIQKDNGMNTLVLGQYSKERLIYRGHVTLGVKLDFLQDHKCNRMDFSPFTLTPSGNEGVVWLEPSLVGVVEYMPNTKDSLRQAVFKGVRDDIEAKECKIK